MLTPATFFSWRRNNYTKGIGLVISVDRREISSTSWAFDEHRAQVIAIIDGMLVPLDFTWFERYATTYPVEGS